MEIKHENGVLCTTAYIFGEIDHHNAKSAREQLDEIIDKEQPITFNLELSGVTFCDSRERIHGLGSPLTNDAFLGMEERRRDPSARPRCSHLFWKRK